MPFSKKKKKPKQNKKTKQKTTATKKENSAKKQAKPQHIISNSNSQREMQAPPVGHDNIYVI